MSKTTKELLDSFAGFCGRTQPKYFSYALRELGNRDSADEAVQETCRRVWSKWALVDSLSPPEQDAYGWKTLKRIIIDRKKRLSKHPEQSLDQPVSDDEGRETTLATLPVSSELPPELQAQLHELMGKWPDLCQELQVFMEVSPDYLELMHELMLAIAKLPEQERRVVILRDFKYLSLAEIADVLRMSERNAQHLHLKARRHLREILGRSDDVPLPGRE